MAYPDFLGLIGLIFVTSAILCSVQSLFFWELTFCMFCYSYDKNGRNSPKRMRP